MNPAFFRPVRSGPVASGPATVPDAPTIGTAVETGENSADVPYTASASNGGASITQYRAISTPGSFTGVLNTAGSGTISVTGLASGTPYTFTVSAVNSVGRSAESAASNEITTEGFPATEPGAPTIGTATATGAHTATVGYTAPGSNGGAAITQYRAISTPGSLTGVLNTAGSGTITVGALDPLTDYTFTVSCINSIGRSAESAASNEITTDETDTGGDPNFPMPVREFIAFHGPAVDTGCTIGKHTNIDVDLRDGVIYFMGGDGADSVFGNDFMQYVWALDLPAKVANLADRAAGWTMSYPYVGVVGEDQPVRPDWGMWTWDKSINRFWWVPGLSVPIEDVPLGTIANYQPLTNPFTWADTSVPWVSPDPVAAGLNVIYSVDPNELQPQAWSGVYSTDLSTAYVDGVHFTAAEDTPTLGRLTLTKIGAMDTTVVVGIGGNTRFPTTRSDLEPGVPLATGDLINVHMDVPATLTQPGFLAEAVWQYDPTPQGDGFGRWHYIHDCVGLSTQKSIDNKSWGGVLDLRNGKIIKGVSASSQTSWLQAYKIADQVWDTHVEFANPTTEQGTYNLWGGQQFIAHDPLENVSYYMVGGLDDEHHFWRLNLEGNVYGKTPYTFTYIGTAPVHNGTDAWRNDYYVLTWDSRNRRVVWFNWGNTDNTGVDDGLTAQLFEYTPGNPVAEIEGGSPAGSWGAAIDVTVSPSNDLCNGLSHTAHSTPFPATGRSAVYNQPLDCHIFHGDVLISDPTALTAIHFYAIRLTAGRPLWNQGQESRAWRELEGSSMSLAPYYDLSNGYNIGAGAAQHKVDGWNGLVMDTRTGRVYNNAIGGHNDYYGNEIGMLDLLTDAPICVELLAPSAYTDILVGGENAIYQDGKYGAAHTYNTQVFIESMDRAFRFGNGSMAYGGQPRRNVDAYNVDTNTRDAANTWTQIPFTPSSSGGEYSVAKHPLSENVYIWRDSQIVKWTRETQTYAVDIGTSPQTPSYAATTIDPTRGTVAAGQDTGTLIAWGGAAAATPYKYDLASKAYTAITFSGAEAAEVGTPDYTAAKMYACFYSRWLDCYLYYSFVTPGKVIRIDQDPDDATNFICTEFVTTGGGSIPTPILLCTRFLEVYVPSAGLHGALILPDWPSNFWFLQF